MLFSDFGRAGFDPFTEMRRLQQELNRQFADFGSGFGAEFPPINLWVGENSVVATAELPGVGPDDLDLTVREDVLTLRGKRQPGDGGTAAWHRRERTFGDFSRSIQLPFRVDPDKVEARFNNGVLEIELHRPEADRPRKIQIRAV